MLYIKTSPTTGRTWHVGGGVPYFGDCGPVVEIQVDGHELQWLIAAMKAGAAEADKDYYQTVWGVKDAL